MAFRFDWLSTLSRLGFGLGLMFVLLASNALSAYAQAPFQVPCATNTWSLLRDAVVAANEKPGADTINIQRNLSGTPCNIVLNFEAGNFGNGPVGLPRITDALTINGNGAQLTRNPQARPFRLLEATAPLALNDILLGNGLSDNGAGIYSLDDLALTNVVLTNNVSSTLWRKSRPGPTSSTPGTLVTELRQRGPPAAICTNSPASTGPASPLAMA
jgi:hypothetical protein